MARTLSVRFIKPGRMVDYSELNGHRPETVINLIVVIHVPPPGAPPNRHSILMNDFVAG